MNVLYITYLIPSCPKKHLPGWLELLNTRTASLQKGKSRHNECPAYDTKQSESEVPVMLELK